MTKIDTRKRFEYLGGNSNEKETFAQRYSIRQQSRNLEEDHESLQAKVDRRKDGILKGSVDQTFFLNESQL